MEKRIVPDQPLINVTINYTTKDFARELSELFPITEDGAVRFVATLSKLIMRELWSGKYVQLGEFGILHLMLREGTPGSSKNNTPPRPTRLLARLWVDKEYRKNVVMLASPAATMARGKYLETVRNVMVFPKSDAWLTVPQKYGKMVDPVQDDGSAILDYPWYARKK